MLFALVAHDRAGALADRLAKRPAHLAHLEALGDRLKLAGPFLDADGNMNGSIVVIDAADQAEAEALFGRDPFMDGVFADIEIRPFRLTINKTAT
jgi:uncharacterized protein YciI